MDTSHEIADLRELLAHYGTEDHVFTEPWQARAFALALALSERGVFSLRDFQAALIARITLFENSQCIAGTADYYTCWIEALDDVLAQRSVLPARRLSDVEREVADNAESRKAHQRTTSRDANGRLMIAPLVVDPGLA